MQVDAVLRAPVSTDALFQAVHDLSGYPSWLELVRRAEPAAPVGYDEGPAWNVELRGRIGPLARSKRLRMVRTHVRQGAEIRFERREHDGREHSPWVLDARVASTQDGAELTMSLSYGGRFSGPLLHRLLRDEIERARPRLASVAAEIEGQGA